MPTKLVLPWLVVLPDEPGGATLCNAYDVLSRLSTQTRPMSKATYGVAA